MKVFVIAYKNRWVNVVVGAMAIIFSEAYLLFMFGLYNITAHTKVMEPFSNQRIDDSYLRVFHYGAQYIFNFPAPSLDGSLVPLIQFFTGLVYNGIIVGSIVKVAINRNS